MTLKNIKDIIENPELLKEIRTHHIQLYTVLHKTTTLFQKHDINYSIFGGCVIGQLRNNELILWDDDVDLVILDEDLHKLTSKKFKSDCFNMKMSLVYQRKVCYHIVNEPGPFDYQMRTAAQIWTDDNMYKKKLAGSPNILDIFVYKKNPKTNMCDYCALSGALSSKWWKNRFISYESIKNTKVVQLGPLDVKMMRDPIDYLKTFAKGDFINEEFVITHNHSDNFINIFNFNLPYKLNKDEIKLIKSLRLDVKFEELLL